MPEDTRRRYAPEPKERAVRMVAEIRAEHDSEWAAMIGCRSCSGSEPRILAGPVEATAVGNLLIQARATGLRSGGLPELRALVAATQPIQHYQPSQP